MKRYLATALLFLMTSQVSFAVDTTQMPTPELQKRYLGLTEMLNAGKSDDDVRNYMVARYGNFILFRPPVSTKTIWLWATPGILLLIGAAVAVRITKQRAALVGQDNEPVEEDARS
jgi:cytochrome c-type biogenesis protein CcmH/NrfF